MVVTKKETKELLDYHSNCIVNFEIIKGSYRLFPQYIGKRRQNIPTQPHKEEKLDQRIIENTTKITNKK